MKIIIVFQRNISLILKERRIYKNKWKSLNKSILSRNYILHYGCLRINHKINKNKFIPIFMSMIWLIKLAKNKIIQNKKCAKVYNLIIVIWFKVI